MIDPDRLLLPMRNRNKRTPSSNNGRSAETNRRDAKNGFRTWRYQTNAHYQEMVNAELRAQNDRMRVLQQNKNKK